MFHKIVSTIGLGILGADPITAVYILSMGLRKEKKFKITSFFLSFAGFSIFLGVLASSILGIAAVDFLKRIIPDDNSPFWAVLNFVISIVILLWIFKKVFWYTNKKEKSKKKFINGNNFKYIITGLVFSITCFTDPTFYAVILMGSESDSILISILLLTIWFVVSQFMAIITYIAHELNLLDNLVAFVDRLKSKNMKKFTYVFYAILVAIALLLMIDSGVYWLSGKYLF